MSVVRPRLRGGAGKVDIRRLVVRPGGVGAVGAGPQGEEALVYVDVAGEEEVGTAAVQRVVDCAQRAGGAS